MKNLATGNVSGTFVPGKIKSKLQLGDKILRFFTPEFGAQIDLTLMLNKLLRRIFNSIPPIRLNLSISAGLILTACGGGNIDYTEPPMTDFRSSYIYFANSNINKLYIQVISQITVQNGNTSYSYVMTKEHPRESTFGISPPYSQVIQEARGGSFITFMYGLDTDSVIVDRRYALVDSQNISYLHECRSKNDSFIDFYTKINVNALPKITEENIINEIQSGGQFFGRYEYIKGAKKIVIDFPVALINGNPAQSPDNGDSYSKYQVVSAQVPIYIDEGLIQCESISPGYLAFKNLNGEAYAIYICRYRVGNSEYYDYACTLDIKGKLNIYRVNV